MNQYKRGVERLKKAIISGVVLCSILLGGCNNIEVIESEQEVVVSYNTLFAELQNEIIKSITEQTELDSDALAIMIDGGGGESTVAVGYPKDSKIEGKLIQQTGVHFNETTEEMVFSFDTKNKTGEKVYIQFGQWQIDESIYNLTADRPLYLDKVSGVRSFQKRVQRSYLKEWDKTIMEMKILDAESNTIIRELEFQINKQYTLLF